jgi:hypothetical protein
MSYYLKERDYNPKTEYKRISEFQEGLVRMKQNGFVYLIIRDAEKQWENAVCLSTGQLESRLEIETRYEEHKLGFIKINGIVELKQVPDVYQEIEKIIAENVGWDSAGEIMSNIIEAGLI